MMVVSHKSLYCLLSTYRYLEEAVLSLDKENAVTKEHMKVILTQLCQKLSKFLTGTPLHDMGRMAKRLLMVTQSSLTC